MLFSWLSCCTNSISLEREYPKDLTALPDVTLSCVQSKNCSRNFFFLWIFPIGRVGKIKDNYLELGGFIMILRVPSLWLWFLSRADLGAVVSVLLPECLAEDLTLRRMTMVAKVLPLASMTAWFLGILEFGKRISGQVYLSKLTGPF